MTDVSNPEIEKLEHTLVGLDPSMVRCPYAYYGALRDEPGLYYSQALGCYVVSRFDDVSKVVSDADLFTSRYSMGPPAFADADRARIWSAAGTDPEFADCRNEPPWIEQEERTLVSADGEAHARTRKVVNLVFAPRRVNRLAPRIEEISAELIEGISHRDSWDFVPSFTQPYPSLVICAALGVPPEDWHLFNGWIGDIARGVGSLNLSEEDQYRRLRAHRDLSAYVRAMLKSRALEPRDDLVSVIATGAGTDAHLSANEQLDIVIQLLFAGNETTGNLLASALLRLGSDLQLQSRLRSQPTLIPPFLEEMLRLESPVQALFRTATRDTYIAGTAIPAGSAVMVVFASGNRDPAHFTDADNMQPLERLSERAQVHLSFGRGVHYCVGAPLARLDTRIALEQILGRLPMFELDTPEEAVERKPSFILHGPESVKVRRQRP